MNTITVDQLTFENFSVHLQTRFSVFVDDGRCVELELAEAQSEKSIPRVGSPGGALQNHSFSLLFKGPEKLFLPQGVYRFEHGRIGQFELFIVPVGRETGAFVYEVIFNRVT